MESVNCPNCGKYCYLDKSLNDFFIGKINSKIFVDFISYHCDNCSESYTTTETDELNLIQINKGISKFKRLQKIKNILK
jgi:hypothetical protein